MGKTLFNILPLEQFSVTPMLKAPETEGSKEGVFVSMYFKDPCKGSVIQEYGAYVREQATKEKELGVDDEDGFLVGEVSDTEMDEDKFLACLVDAGEALAKIAAKADATRVRFSFGNLRYQDLFALRCKKEKKVTPVLVIPDTVHASHSTPSRDDILSLFDKWVADTIVDEDREQAAFKASLASARKKLVARINKVFK